MKGTIFFVILGLAGFINSAEPVKAKPQTLFLHYQWIKGTIILVDSHYSTVKIKQSRKNKHRYKNRLQRLTNYDKTSTLSYSVTSVDNDILIEKYLPEPGVIRAEFQDHGQDQIHGSLVHTDTSDIFIRIPIADAASIKFYRHNPGDGFFSRHHHKTSSTVIAEFDLSKAKK